ncbi:MAG: hypothetical protein WCP06_13280 [Verrucomicrobiota bacterium]
MSNELEMLSVPGDERDVRLEVSLSEINGALPLPVTTEFPGAWPVELACRARAARLLMWEASFSPEKSIKQVSPDCESLDNVGKKVLATVKRCWDLDAHPDPERVSSLVEMLDADWWPDHYQGCLTFEETGCLPEWEQQLPIPNNSLKVEADLTVRAWLDQQDKYRFKTVGKIAFEYAWKRAAEDDDEWELILSEDDEPEPEPEDDEDELSERRVKSRRRSQARRQLSADAEAAATVWMARISAKYPHLPLYPTNAAEESREAAIVLAAEKESQAMAPDEREVFSQAIDHYLQGGKAFNYCEIDLAMDLKRLRAGWKLSASQRDAVARALMRTRMASQPAGNGDVDAIHPQLRFGITFARSSPRSEFHATRGEIQLVRYGSGADTRYILCCPSWPCVVTMTPAEFSRGKAAGAAIFRDVGIAVGTDWREVWEDQGLSKSLLADAETIDTSQRRQDWIEYGRSLALEAPAADRPSGNGEICRLPSGEILTDAKWLTKRAEEDGIIHEWERDAFRAFWKEDGPGRADTVRRPTKNGTSRRYLVIDVESLPAAAPRLAGPADGRTAGGAPGRLTDDNAA